ncbi:A/G-specific adenine glycosylase [Streptococcus tangpeifui]|uniref:A/G-specific adenine glycosylase n=1 Tax=Streptococcus tangpeifui TaxID=2709400 RepID=UPI0032161EFF
MKKKLNLRDFGIEMWDQPTIFAFRRTLLDWYDREKRDLPWRRTKNPYYIWISETMLQQTQVQTVIPYYQRFLDLFPTVDDLASAPEERLLKAWEGLGYYSRVRNMQVAAQQIVGNFDGEFPKSYDEIASLKGIGPYTAGAIASIAFDLPEPAVDGNVMRVIARLFEVDYDIGNPSNRKLFQAIMEELIDPKRPGDFNQALMDLGTDIESAKNPRPDESPIRAFNAAYLHGTYDKYPIKLPKKKPKPMTLQAFVIQNDKGEFLLEKNQKDGLLAGFWSFPIMETQLVGKQLSLFDKTDNQVLDSLSLLKVFEDDYQINPVWQETNYPLVKHTFSHQKWQVQLIAGKVGKAQFSSSRELRWVAPEDFEHFPMATPQKKMIDAFEKVQE